MILNKSQGLSKTVNFEFASLICRMILFRSQEECNHKYDLIPVHDYDYYLPNKLQPTQFCAGNYDVNVRTYYGDSGGPAIKRYEE